MKRNPAPLEHLLPDDLPPAELGHHLGAGSGVTKTGAEVFERTLLDTFDWRLYSQGTIAEATGGAHPVFRWLRRKDGRVLRQAPGDAPRFAWDLPRGSFRQDLERRLEMRALLPRVRVRSRVETFALRDRQAKIVLRLRVEENTLLGETETPLRSRLHLEPVKGYAKALDRARRTLIAPLGLEPAPDDLLTEALAVLHVTPGTYSSKVRVTLKPDLPAGEACRAILLQLLNIMEINEAGTVADLDSEFLHDFRVSVRRTRAALGQVKGVLPAAVLGRFREEFAWLGSITGPTRDLDVYLLNFPEYRANLPPGVREQLEPLHAFLKTHQRTEQQLLAKALRSARYRSIKKDWRQFLESGPEENGEGQPPNAARPVLAVAREQIWKIYRRVLRDGAVLDADCPAEWFHELRKTCKKLRYLLEFFQSLFPADAVSTPIKALKIIQDNLGVHNDLDVQAASLAGFGQRMAAEGAAPAGCLMAMGMLVEDLGRRQTQVRGEFAQLFTRFSARNNHKRFHQLFAPPARGKEKGAGG